MLNGFFWLLVSLLPALLVFYLFGGLILSLLRISSSTIFLSFIVAWFLSGLVALIMADRPTAQAAIDVGIGATLMTSLIVQLFTAVVGKRRPKSEIIRKTSKADLISKIEKIQKHEEASRGSATVRNEHKQSTGFTPMTLKPIGSTSRQRENSRQQENPNKKTTSPSSVPQRSEQKGVFSDLDYYEIAADEVKNNTVQKGVWAMAMAKVGSTSKDEIVPKYVELRVLQLKEQDG